MSEIQSLLKLVLMLQFRCNQQEAAWLGLDHFLLPVPLISRFRLAGLPALIDRLPAASGAHTFSTIFSHWVGPAAAS